MSLDICIQNENASACHTSGIPARSWHVSDFVVDSRSTICRQAYWSRITDHGKCDRIHSTLYHSLAAHRSSSIHRSLLVVALEVCLLPTVYRCTSNWYFCNQSSKTRNNGYAKPTRLLGRCEIPQRCWQTSDLHCRSATMYRDWQENLKSASCSVLILHV